MNKPTLTGSKKYHQGVFTPKNPVKYLGNPTNIIYRSGWERSFLRWCDITPAVLKYNSEEVVIPYVSPIDGKVHRYFIDFFIVVQQKTGIPKKFLVEIKPYAQTKVPKMKTGVLSESNKKSVETYMVNQAKWAAARDFCAKNGLNFIILTEKELMKPRKNKRG